MIHKRYWVFGGEDYYPSGGMGDFIDSFDDYEKACCFIRDKINHGVDWGNVFDTETGKSFSIESAYGIGVPVRKIEEESNHANQ